MTPETQTNAPSTPTIPAPRAAEDGRPPEDLINSAASAQGYQSPHRLARGHGYEQRGLAYLPVSRLFEGRFGRMFRLPPFIPSEARIAEIAATMAEGSTGGDPTLDNPDIPSGYTYFGQFVDHDLTFDPVSSLTRTPSPTSARRASISTASTAGARPTTRTSTTSPPATRTSCSSASTTTSTTCPGTARTPR
jgi:hypothetical protein